VLLFTVHCTYIDHLVAQGTLDTINKAFFIYKNSFIIILSLLLFSIYSIPPSLSSLPLVNIKTTYSLPFFILSFSE
jgi:hypothetical protein